jgi:glutaredoxin
MYSTSWCGYCKKAKAFFRGQGVSVTEYDVETDKAAAIRMKRLSGGKSVPFVVIGDAKIRGYNEAAYLQALAR